jgi:hypothetical protein
MEFQSISSRVITLILRAALLGTLFMAGWGVYNQLPSDVGPVLTQPNGETSLQIVLRQSPGMSGVMLDIPIEISPVDIVAVRHEFFSERQAGKSFDDFRNERMNGRKSVRGRLDQKGQMTVVISQGSWWVHAVLSGEEDLEWRLPIKVSGSKQVIELTTQNAYGRTKSF